MFFLLKKNRKRKREDTLKYLQILFRNKKVKLIDTFVLVEVLSTFFFFLSFNLIYKNLKVRETQIERAKMWQADLDYVLLMRLTLFGLLFKKRK